MTIAGINPFALTGITPFEAIIPPTCFAHSTENEVDPPLNSPPPADEWIPPTPPSREERGQIAAELGHDLRDIWEHSRRRNLSLIRLPWEKEPEDGTRSFESFRFPTTTKEIPKTGEMIDVILEAQARRKGCAIEELTVVAAFHGGNVMEILMWLEKGVRVIAADTSTSAGFSLRHRLKRGGHDTRRLTTTNPFWARTPKGDIVTACHPNPSPWDLLRFPPWSYLQNPARSFTGYGNPGALFIVQSDYIDSYTEPLIADPRFSALLHVPINPLHYFFPSPLLWKRSELLIAAHDETSSTRQP